jgi:hypothetical protein
MFDDFLRRFQRGFVRFEINVGNAGIS